MPERTFPAEVAVAVVCAVAADVTIKMLSRLAAWATAHVPPEAWPLILQLPGSG